MRTAAARLARWLVLLSLLGGWAAIPGVLRVTASAPLTHPPGTSAQESEPSLVYAGIDFGKPGELIKIKIASPRQRINGGNPIVIKFYPGQACSFGERQACIQAYHSASGQNVIFITVHSGLGAEAEMFRNAVEGSGFLQSGLPLEKTLARLGDLEGMEVTIVQGDQSVRGLRLAALGRIPAQGVNEYFAVPVAQSLAVAAGYDESLAWAVDPGEPLVVFETCGWRMRNEPGSKSLPATSASVYLGVIASAQP